MSDYQDIYKDGGIYDRIDYGSPYISKGLKFAKYLSAQYPKESKVLCVGCGNGFEVVVFLKAGFNAFGTELHQIDVPYLKDRIINARAPDLPFKDNEMDLLLCCEVLEHVPEEETDDFLKECVRVGKNCFFSIATKMDAYKTHINVHSPQWWLDKFDELSLKVLHFEFKPQLDLLLAPDFCFRLRWPSGVTVHVG